MSTTEPITVEALLTMQRAAADDKPFTEVDVPQDALHRASYKRMVPQVQEILAAGHELSFPSELPEAGDTVAKGQKRGAGGKQQVYDNASGRYGSSKLSGAELRTVAEANPDGFTMRAGDKHLYEPGKDKGYVVGRGDSSLVVPADGIAQADLDGWLKGLNSDHVGGWLDTEDNVYVFDPVQVITDKEEAVRLGRRRDQKAIFDLENAAEVDTGGTGGY